MVDREKFLAKVRTNNLTCVTVAGKLSIDPSSLSSKINGKREFTIGEVEDLKGILKLSQKDINDIFFSQDLQKCKANTQEGSE